MTLDKREEFESEKVTGIEYNYNLTTKTTTTTYNIDAEGILRFIQIDIENASGDMYETFPGESFQQVTYYVYGC